MSEPNENEEDPSEPSDFQQSMAQVQRRAKQAADLAGLKEEIEEQDAHSAGEVSFMASPLVQVTLPHSDPGDVDIWDRQNGDILLYIRGGVKQSENGGGEPLGLPYGAYPRLILSWVCTQVTKHGRRRLDLGESLQSYMRDLGVTPSGGDQGTTRRFRDQMRRLFAAQIGFIWTREGHEKRQAALVAEEMDLWWDPKNPSQTTLWDSSVKLSKPFVEAIKKAPVPADRRVLREIKDSALAIDLYFWTTYRASYIEDSLTLSWQQVHDQMGANYSRVSGFAREARKHLEEISLIWSDLKYETPRGRLRLYPSRPSVVDK
ncbi:replication protein RepA [Salinibacter altiplanensis]|uniref:replication protein RepA n=1 Tax=Salinibacter altiplanensis TaxID=1803181 RepID=UPI000C9EEF5B|nr:replication protein RepA [Salinibacter altiplanensis]